MRLINLKVAGIRGFNIEQEFELDDDLVIIYGPNGQGKTSFAEIIEYLFFGTIYKKENACSKIEFKDTIKNKECSQEECDTVSRISKENLKEISLPNMFRS